MHYEDVQMTLSCLGSERQLMHYFKDRYAVELLSRLCLEPTSVPDIRASNWAPLLHRPTIKDAIGASGSPLLSSAHLARCYPNASLPLIVSFGTWGGHQDWRWQQTSRPGYNLVVLIGLDHQRVKETLRKIGAQREPAWQYWGHPQQKGRLTLAWSRIDIDYTTGEALIEEVQSDLVRRLLWMRPYEDRRHDGKEWVQQRLLGGAPITASNEDCVRALQNLRNELLPLWAEATLWATLQMLWEEIGIEQVYYHTPAGGAQLKGISGGLPPRSLYTDLPKRFGFLPSSCMPYFCTKRNDNIKVVVAAAKPPV